MIDLFLLLTPFLLLGVVALLGFAGCHFQPRGVGSPLTIDPTSGPTSGGTAVTITGSDEAFQYPVTVKFDAGNAGEVDVTGTVTNSTTVTAITPPHAAGDVGVEVDYSVDGNNYSNTLGDNNYYTYTEVDLVVVPLLPPALSRKTTGTTNSAQLPAFSAGTKLVVVTVQWGAGTGVTLNTPTSPGVTFTQIGTTDMLNPQQVATFYGFADLSTGITVTATLSGNTSTDFNLLVSAYDNVDLTTTPQLPASQQGTGLSPALAFTTSALAPGDMLYAVAIARGAGSVLKGSWSAGQGFNGEIGQNDYLLLEVDVLQQTDINSGQVSVTAADGDATATSRWYLFAIAVKHA
jgi:IPT/TIG domain